MLPYSSGVPGLPARLLPAQSMPYMGIPGPNFKRLGNVAVTSATFLNRLFVDRAGTGGRPVQAPVEESTKSRSRATERAASSYVAALPVGTL